MRTFFKVNFSRMVNRPAFLSLPIRSRFHDESRSQSSRYPYISNFGILLGALATIGNSSVEETNNSASSKYKDKVLSLDGGGIRGFITLIILREIEYRLGDNKKIYQLFDFFAGTSTGGIIALGLNKKQPYLEEKTFYQKIPQISQKKSIELYHFLKDKNVIDQKGNIQNTIDDKGEMRYDLDTLAFSPDLSLYREKIISTLRDPGLYRDYPQYQIKDLLYIYEKRGNEIFPNSYLKANIESAAIHTFNILAFPVLVRLFRSFDNTPLEKDIVPFVTFGKVSFQNVKTVIATLGIAGGMYLNPVPGVFIGSGVMSVLLSPFALVYLALGRNPVLEYLHIPSFSSFPGGKELGKEFAKHILTGTLICLFSTIFIKSPFERNIYDYFKWIYDYFERKNFPDNTFPENTYPKLELSLNYMMTAGLFTLLTTFRPEIHQNSMLIGGPRYDPEKLEKLLLEYFGNTTLQQMVKPVFVTSHNVTDDVLDFFCTLEQDPLIANIKIREVARATSAAPGYFPPQIMGQPEKVYIVSAFDLRKCSQINNDRAVILTNKGEVYFIDNRKVVMKADNTPLVVENIDRGEIDLAKSVNPQLVSAPEKVIKRIISNAASKGYIAFKGKQYIDAGIHTNDPSLEAYMYLQSLDKQCELFPIGTGEFYQPSDLDYNLPGLYWILGLFNTLLFHHSRGIEQKIAKLGWKKIQVPLPHEIDLDDVSEITVKKLDKITKAFIREEGNAQIDRVCQRLDSTYQPQPERRFFWNPPSSTLSPKSTMAAHSNLINPG